ncbi:MAG: DedA family protein [Desulfuromonadales bacterium]
METWFKELLILIPDGPLFAATLGILALTEGLVGLGLVVPGAILTVFGGFLVYHGKGDLLSVFAAVSCGAIVGDIISYILGARFGRQLWGRGLLRKHVDLLRKAQNYFYDHGGKSVFLGRFIGPLRGLVPFIAGASHMRPLPFLGWAVISGLFWGIGYPGLGYLGGTSWELARRLSGGAGLLIALIAAVVICYIWRRRQLKPPRENP